jgi:hypothetical protein
LHLFFVHIVSPIHELDRKGILILLR